MSNDSRTVLEALIGKWHLTKPAAAQLVIDAGTPVTAVTARHIGGVASGERKPSAEMSAALERAFGMPIAELLAGYTGQLLPSAPPQRAVSTTPSTDPQEALRMAAQRAHKYKVTYQTRVDTSSLAEDVQHLAHAYPQQPLAEIMYPLVAAQEAAYEQLEGRSMHTASGRELHFLIGVTTGMLAKAAHDSGNPPKAIDLARAAGTAGDLADHPTLQAWVAGLQALVTYWAGRPRESIRHAQRAAHLAQGTASTVPVWAAVSEARAWAQLGNVDEVQNALISARTAESAAAGDDLDHDFGGQFTFPRARGLYYSAEAAVTAGLVDDAVRYGNDAVEAYRDPSTDYWAFGDASGAAAALATARIQQGEIEGAHELLVPVFDLPPAQRINGVVQCIQPVYRAVTGADTGAAGRELGDRIEAFTRVPMRAVTE